MTGDYVNLELAAKRGNPSIIWRSGQVLLSFSTGYSSLSFILSSLYTNDSTARSCTLTNNNWAGSLFWAWPSDEDGR
jgi:hypothetical protein